MTVKTYKEVKNGQIDVATAEIDIQYPATLTSFNRDTLIVEMWINFAPVRCA